jgi:protein SCO1/2
MRLSWIIVTIALIAILFSRAHLMQSPIKKPEVLSLPTGSVFSTQATLPAVSFVDHHGKNVKQADFLDHWSLFFFGYASCPEFCPVIVQAMDHIGRNFKGHPLNFYFVSIDPLTDTPEHLQDFLTRYKTPIIGLNGSLDDVQSLAQFFKLMVEKADGQERHIEHSASLVLVDPQGHPVGLFSDYERPKQIAEDIRYAQYYLAR